ncbi:MAG: hypothetical protein P8L20_03310 [Flavobacteriales bacterium]|nr:hypothetical protein [Flavobacteriales bacterium]
MFKVLSISFLLCTSGTFQGQNTGITLENPLDSENSTLANQHKFIMEQSKSYVNNKVVKIEWIKKFYSNVKDSLESVKYERSIFEKAYTEEIKVSKDALNSATALKKELDLVNSEKENITFFGSITSKSSYKKIVWTAIISLSAFLLLFLFKYKNSNRSTKEIKEKLNEIELDLEQTKKKARIKEQELMRKLQDEINKNT